MSEMGHFRTSDGHTTHIVEKKTGIALCGHKPDEERKWARAIGSDPNCKICQAADKEIREPKK